LPDEDRLLEYSSNSSVTSLEEINNKKGGYSPLGKAKLAFEFRVFWHQHTTGKLPECTRYIDFKRSNAQAMSAGAVPKGPVLSGPQWDNLALSQYAVLSKLAEIAVFEDGRWTVHPDVIRRFSQRLNSFCGLSDSNALHPDMDNTAISTFMFPPWQFLSDVAKVTLRSNRLSAAKRRSLEIPTKEPDVDGPLVEPVPVHDDRLDNLPHVILHSIQVSDLNDKPILVNRVESSAVSVEASSIVPVQDDAPESDHVFSSVTPGQGSSNLPTSKATTMTTTPSRKRLTLDSFFTPPSSKRSHSVPVKSSPAVDEVILIDDSP
uniref:DBR1 domain-containing protein n=1 Tax=Echinostoma caproni TaxID=27848 RepID=A0A183AU82_9TREM